VHFSRCLNVSRDGEVVMAEGKSMRRIYMYLSFRPNSNKILGSIKYKLGRKLQMH